MTPKEYMAEWCRERNVDMVRLIAAPRSRLRGTLAADLKRRFPKLSLNAIGALLGGLEHTTVLYALTREGVEVDKARRNILTDDVIAEIRRIYRETNNIDLTAKSVNVSTSTVRVIVRPEDAKRINANRARYAANLRERRRIEKQKAADRLQQKIKTEKEEAARRLKRKT